MKAEMYDLTHWQTHHWTKGTSYYAARLHQSLFGDWQVQRQSGDRGRRGGRSLTLPASSYAEALSLMESTAKRRQQRGYTKIEE